MTDPKSPLCGTNAAVNVPVHAFRKADVVVTPSTAVVTQSGDRATARLLIHGRRIAKGTLRAITCDRGTVSWTSTEPTASGVTVLQLLFAQNADKATTIQIEVDGADPVRVSVSWPDMHR